jgi:isoleucyl-tRNA synthetase
MTFQDTSNKVDFVQLEQNILKFWRDSDAFNELRRLRAQTEAEHGIFSFIDGPITANNPMGVHHAWGRTYKDLYQRYHAMLGKNQRWQNGFDCQGLWVEVNVEKGSASTASAKSKSLAWTNLSTNANTRVSQLCRRANRTIPCASATGWTGTSPAELRMLRDKLTEDPTQEVTVPGPNGPVTGTVEQVIGQLGLPQMGGSYFTFSDENNYQIWAFLRKCFDNGWIYKGTDVMPWCARCGTGISQHEIVTEGYQEVTHDSVFVRFPIVTAKPQRSSETLRGFRQRSPARLDDHPLDAHQQRRRRRWPGTHLRQSPGTKMAGPTTWPKKRVKNTLIGKNNEVVGRLKGEEMVGWTYRGPFDELPAVQKAFLDANYTHRVIPWKEVGAAEGTGIVHIAPGCGAEDFRAEQGV